MLATDHPLPSSPMSIYKFFFRTTLQVLPVLCSVIWAVMNIKVAWKFKVRVTLISLALVQGKHREECSIHCSSKGGSDFPFVSKTS